MFAETALLTLDDPTNNLDLSAVSWLDNHLTTWKKTLLVVSHDQDFLNSTYQQSMNIEDLKVASCKGNCIVFKNRKRTKGSN